ncbi:MAG: 2OG-Fe(II) oxygenase [Planctomycetales bacterium]|jgi:SM-20-related protein
MKQILPPSPPLELLEQATVSLKSHLSRDPGNGQLLHRLALLYRKQGLLADATEVYQQILSSDSTDRQAYYMHQVLRTGSVPDSTPTEGTRPAPFVLIEDFLPAEEHAELMPLVLAEQEAFAASLVGEGEYRPETRESRTLPGPRPEKKQFRSRVKDALPDVIRRLQVPSFAVDMIEVKIRAYSDGDFFEVHQDNSERNHRQVSYVYFFHREPRAYQGGDLLLMDTDINCDSYIESNFTRVVPQNNCVAFFPSSYYHTVIPVLCPSREFGDGRFVINGHVQKNMEGCEGSSDEKSKAA